MRAYSSQNTIIRMFTRAECHPPRAPAAGDIVTDAICQPNTSPWRRNQQQTVATPVLGDHVCYLATLGCCALIFLASSGVGAMYFNATRPVAIIGKRIAAYRRPLRAQLELRASSRNQVTVSRIRGTMYLHHEPPYVKNSLRSPRARC